MSHDWLRYITWSGYQYLAILLKYVVLIQVKFPHDKPFIACFFLLIVEEVKNSKIIIFVEKFLKGKLLSVANILLFSLGDIKVEKKNFLI